MKTRTIKNMLGGDPYPGRGILVGLSEDGKSVVSAYWIMGRSEKSRNRIFIEKNGVISTAPYDKTLKMGDTSLILYDALMPCGKYTIITNGTQTATIKERIGRGGNISNWLKGVKYEEDPPSFTPRISSVIEVEKNNFTYSMAVIKRCESGEEGCCLSSFYLYERSFKNTAHLIHTYENATDPLISFSGEPKAVLLGKESNDIEIFAPFLFKAIDNDNLISLFVHYIRLDNEKKMSVILNKRGEERG